MSSGLAQYHCCESTGGLNKAHRTRVSTHAHTHTADGVPRAPLCPNFGGNPLKPGGHSSNRCVPPSEHSLLGLFNITAWFPDPAPNLDGSSGTADRSRNEALLHSDTDLRASPLCSGMHSDLSALFPQHVSPSMLATASESGFAE